MKNLAISFATALVSSVIMYFGLSMILHGEALVSLAAVPFSAVSPIYEALERRQTTQRITKAPDNLPTFDGFAIPWYLVTCYGALTVIGIVQGCTGLGGALAARAALAGAVVGDARHVALIAVAIAIPLILAGFYFLGVWVGVRSGRLGFLSLLLAIAIGQAIIHTADFLLAPPTQFKAFFGADKTGAIIVLPVIGGIILFTPIAAIGLWRGRRRRLSRYLFYLLSLLSPESRTAIVALAYDEARLISSKRPNAA